jgi:hypothetical protein
MDSDTLASATISGTSISRQPSIIVIYPQSWNSLTTFLIQIAGLFSLAPHCSSYVSIINNNLMRSLVELNF